MSVMERRQIADFTRTGLGPYPSRADDRSVSTGRRLEDRLLANALLQLAKIACEAIPKALSAGILMYDDSGRRTTGATSGQNMERIDAAQFDHGVGPCLDARQQGRIVRIDDMRDSVGQCPAFSAAALSKGVFSTLSLPLVVSDAGVGVMNLYAGSTHGFGADDEELANDLAAVAMTTLSLRQGYSVAQQVVERRNPAAGLRFPTVHATHGFSAVLVRDGINLTVHVRGELDVATRPVFWSALSQAIADGSGTVYVDLAGLEFIDAYGLGSLVSARDALRLRSRDLTLLNLSTHIAKVMSVAGLDELLDCCKQQPTVVTPRPSP